METMLDAKVDMTLNYEQVLQSITRDDVRNILTQLLKQNNYSEIIMKGVAR
jgi:zinc protease